MQLATQTIHEIHDLCVTEAAKPRETRMTQRQIGEKHGISGSVVNNIFNHLDRVLDNTPKIRVNLSYQASGRVCSECNVWFEKERGFPVVCEHCSRFIPMKGRKVKYPVATEKEIGVR